MHNLYGDRKLNPLEIKGGFTLSNGMYCVWGKTTDEGLSVDVYDDETKQLLVGLEHHIIWHKNTPDSDMAEVLGSMMENIREDLEDSMVYYYGPRECAFDTSTIKEPFPKKTGRFVGKSE